MSFKTINADTTRQVLSQASDNIPLATAYHMFKLRNRTQKEGRSKNMSPLISYLDHQPTFSAPNLISANRSESNLFSPF